MADNRTEKPTPKRRKEARDFPGAVKELNLALQTCPDVAKNQIKGLIAKAEQKQDINP